MKRCRWLIKVLDCPSLSLVLLPLRVLTEREARKKLLEKRLNGQVCIMCSKLEV